MKNKEYLRHELLDRTSILGAQVEAVLVAHASMRAGSKTFKRADQARIKLELDAAVDHLMAAYQIIGGIHL